MMEMAQAQQGGGTSVDPMPLVKLLAARSRCFTVVDRGAGYDALQRERAIEAGQGGWTHIPFKDKLRDRITTAGGYPTVRLPSNMRPIRSYVQSAMFPFVGRQTARARVGGMT